MTFEELVKAAAALQAPTIRGPFADNPIKPTPLPLTPWMAFKKTAQAEAMGGVLSAVPGLIHLATGTAIPGMAETVQQIHDVPKRWTGIIEDGFDHRTEHPVAATLGSLVGTVVGALPGGVGGFMAARTVLTRVLPNLAARAPVAAMGIHATLESIGAEATTANPSWPSVAAWGVVDMALRSRQVSKFIDALFPKLRKPKLGIWDPHRGHWMRVADFVREAGEPGQVFAALQTIAQESGQTVDTIAKAVFRPGLQNLWKAGLERTSTGTTNGLLAVFDDGTTIALTTPDNILAATEQLIGGKSIQRIIGSSERLKILEEAVLAQSPQELTYVLGKTPVTTAPEGTKPGNYLLVKHTDSKEADLAPLTRQGMESIAKAVRGGRAAVLDVVALRPETLDQDLKHVELLFPKRYAWDAPNTYTVVAEPGQEGLLVEFGSSTNRKEISFPLEGGKISAEAVAFIEKNPGAVVRVIALADPSDLPRRYELHQVIRRLRTGAPPPQPVVHAKKPAAEKSAVEPPVAEAPTPPPEKPKEPGQGPPIMTLESPSKATTPPPASDKLPPELKRGPIRIAHPANPNSKLIMDFQSDLDRALYVWWRLRDSSEKKAKVNALANWITGQGIGQRERDHLARSLAETIDRIIREIPSSVQSLRFPPYTRTGDVGYVTKVLDQIEFRTFPTGMPAELVAALRRYTKALPEDIQPFLQQILPVFRRTFGIDEVVAQGGNRGKFLLTLEDGLRAGDITPYDYTVLAILTRNLPDELFEATKLTLAITDKPLREGALAQIKFDVVRNTTTIIANPNTSYQVLAHELAELAIRLLKPAHAKELVDTLLNKTTLDEAGNIANLANFYRAVAEGADATDTVAGLLGEYMVQRYVFEAIPQEAASIIERTSVWQRFRELAKSLWSGIRHLLGIRGEAENPVYQVFDKIFTPASQGGWLEARTLREGTGAAQFKHLAKALEGTRNTVGASVATAKAITRDLREQAVLELGKYARSYLRQADTGQLIIRGDPKHTAEVLKGVVRVAVRALGINPDQVTHVPLDLDVLATQARQMYYLDAVPRSKGVRGVSYHALTGADTTTPIGLHIVQEPTPKGPVIHVFTTSEYLNHLVGFARPDAVRLDMNEWIAFVKAARSGYERRLRTELVESLTGDKKHLVDGIIHRLIYNVGLSHVEASKIRLLPSPDPRYLATLDGPVVDRIAKRLERMGWTLDDLLLGFRGNDNRLALDRWVRATLRNTLEVGDHLTVNIDPGIKPDTAVLHYVTGTEERVNLATLRRVLFSRQKGITRIEVGDPNTASLLIQRNVKDTAPLLIIRDGAITDDYVTFYLRRDGYPLSPELDEVVLSDGIIHQNREAGMTLHRFSSPDLQLALAAGYKVQAVYGRFHGMSVDQVLEQVQRGLQNTPVLDTKDMVYDPAGLRYLIRLADSRGFHLLPAGNKFRLISHTTNEAFVVRDGKEAVDFLLQQPQTEAIDPLVDSLLRQEAERIRFEIGDIETPVNFGSESPARGIVERAARLGKEGVKTALTFFDTMLSPSHRATAAITKMSGGRYDTYAMYNKVREALHQITKEVYDGYVAMVGNSLEGMSREELQQITLALAHYVGAPDSILKSDPATAALRAEFLRVNKLSEKQLAAISRIAENFVDEYHRAAALLASRGEKVPAHIFGYARRTREGLGSPFDDVEEDYLLGVTQAPGQFHDRIVRGIEESKHILPADVMIARYLFASRFYEYGQPLVKELNTIIREIREQTSKTLIDRVALNWYEHMLNNLSSRYGAPPNMVLAAVTNTIQTATNSGVTADQIINDVITYMYGTSLGFKLSAPIRNRTHPVLLLYPLVGGEHTRKGMAMAREFLKNPDGELVKYIDSIHATWTPQAIEETKKIFNLLRDRGDSLAVKYAEVGLYLMQRTETRNKAESYFAGVSLGQDIIRRLASGEPVSEVVASSPLQAFAEAARSRLLAAAEEAVKNPAAEIAALKKFGEAVVAHTAWFYGPLEMPAWTRSRLARLSLMYATWPLNYLRYVVDGVRNSVSPEGGFTPYGRDFIRRLLLVNTVGTVAAGALGIHAGNLFFLGPMEYTGGPLTHLALDALDVARLDGDMRRPAWARFKTQLLRTFIPTGSALRELYRMGSSLEAVTVGKAPPHEPLAWLIGTPERIVRERDR